MEEKIIKRIQELTEEIESIIQEREEYLKKLKRLDSKVMEKSAAIYELRALIESSEQSQE